MSIRQVDRLYKKIAGGDGPKGDWARIDPGIRTEIFQTIMDDVERLMKRMKRCKPGSREIEGIDSEIRKLLMKEIQVIIDDYILARRNGTLRQWEDMYGDINHYIKNFYLYRTADSPESGRAAGNYGFYNSEIDP